MKLLEELNIIPNDLKLYKIALTHTSFANENKVISYERLEFLGDSVLQLIMSEYLYLHDKSEEGEMTKNRSMYVCENALYEYSIKLKLNEYLFLGHGEIENGGKYRKAIVADIFESFIGAMYLDQGFEFVKKFIHYHIIPVIENNEIEFNDDYKSLLQEQVQTDKRSLQYLIIDEDGPAHNKTFTVEVRIDNIIYGRGIGHSKKSAEQLAAKDALLKSVSVDEKEEDYNG